MENQKPFLPDTQKPSSAERRPFSHGRHRRRFFNHPRPRRRKTSADFRYLQILLKRILERIEQGTIELKASDALKIIELKRKFFRNERSKEDMLHPFLEMLERAGKSAEPSKEVAGDEKI